MSTSATVPASPPAGQLIDVKAVSKLLNCSSRHVSRLSESDRMPRPVKLGTLVRWRREDIERWIESGCPETAGGDA